MKSIKKKLAFADVVESCKTLVYGRFPGSVSLLIGKGYQQTKEYGGSEHRALI